MNNYSKEDMELMKKCFEKYQNRFGYITLDNHFKVFIDFCEQVKWIPIEKGLSASEFEIKRKTCIESYKMCYEIVSMHKSQGIPIKVDLEGL